MSSADNKLIWEAYITESPDPAAPTASGKIEDYPPGTEFTAQFSDGAKQLKLDPLHSPTNPRFVDVNGLPVNIPLGSEELAHINSQLAAGTITPNLPQQAQEQPQETSPAQQQKDKLDNTAAWARGAGAVLGTDPAASNIGGGMQKGVGSSDYLTKGAIDLVGKGVQALGQKAAPRADAAIGYRNTNKRSA